MTNKDFEEPNGNDEVLGEEGSEAQVSDPDAQEDTVAQDDTRDADAADGEPLATLNCTAASMATDQSQQFVCPGLSATMPEDYDAVVVQEFSRDTTSG